MSKIKVPDTLSLVIERNSESDQIWGRIEVGDDLIVDFAQTVAELEDKMYQHLSERYKVEREQVSLDVFYDLTALFKEKNFLNLSAIAERAGINRSIMAQYAAGIKYPSLERAGLIQQVIHSIGYELLSVSLAVKSQPIYRHLMEEDPVQVVYGDISFHSPEEYRALSKFLKLHPPSYPAKTDPAAVRQRLETALSMMKKGVKDTPQ